LCGILDAVEAGDQLGDGCGVVGHELRMAAIRRSFKSSLDDDLWIAYLRDVASSAGLKAVQCAHSYRTQSDGHLQNT
ncbi:hypothetical protein KBZ21_44490, partial [Streptomyces sp. A73]|nr:hypothetical protein [Streptomyces sp. A73]